MNYLPTFKNVFARINLKSGPMMFRSETPWAEFIVAT